MPYFALFTYCTLCRTDNRQLIFLGLCSVEEADPKLVRTHFVLILSLKLSLSPGGFQSEGDKTGSHLAVGLILPNLHHENVPNYLSAVYWIYK